MKKTISYPPFLEEILSKIQLARYEILKTVSKQTVSLFWKISKAASQKVQQEKWGKSIAEQLSKDLQTEFLGIRGFSARNIWNMKSFIPKMKNCNHCLQKLAGHKTALF